jgi:hypothetical protein
MPNCTVKKLFRIQNKDLHMQYETTRKVLEDLNRESMKQRKDVHDPRRESFLGFGLEHRLRPIVNELRLFHGTSQDHARLKTPLHAHRIAFPCKAKSKFINPSIPRAGQYVNGGLMRE